MAHRVAVLLVAVACGDNVLPETRIIGQVWSDDNGNGVRDEGEAPVVGATMFINLDFDPTINSGDPVARTNADGIYELIVPGPGTYDVQPRLPFGYRMPTPPSKRRPGRASIVGGGDAGPSDYGFMVSVGSRFGDNVFPMCGGVLIDDRHVVTAAHCSLGEDPFSSVDPAEVAVVAGTLDPFAGGQILALERVTTHPQWFSGNDIALWTLAEPVSLEEAGLTTVEMLTEATAVLATPGTLATAIGWGVSDRESALLQRVHLPLVSNETCRAVYPGMLDTEICAGAPEGGIDTCQGDSGGPLLVRDEARQVWLHAGITSYGDGCGLPGIPGVYARVSAVSEWAMDQVTHTSGSLRVTLDAPGTAVTVDIAARATTRPQIGPIAQRWQLTGMTLPETVPANTPLAVHWSILGDAPVSDFTCRFEPDLAASAPAQDVACDLGTTELPLAGFPTGIFATRLTVTHNDVTVSRRVNVIAGTPTMVNAGGVLDGQDGFDPDYSFGSYRIDYYEVNDLAGTKAFAVDVTSAGFVPFLVLYDLDQRDFVTGGGFLASGTAVDDDVTRLVVVPEAGRRYLIGVSTFEDNAAGSYQISLVNDGTLTAL